jgi:ATP-dependent helicase Lhr and Lhr-like helicase
LQAYAARDMRWSMNQMLPDVIESWMRGRGWHLRAHQQAMLAAGQAGRHALLVAPTGSGKTLSGFLPSLAALVTMPQAGLHTLYVSPLKALAVDVARNLLDPIREMGLAISVETRTGDTPSAKKARQRAAPPQILLTTPESLSLLLSYPDSATLLASLKTLIVDEVHAFAPGKRGDLLALAMTRLQKLAPQLRRVGLSATIADVPAYQRWMSPTASAEDVLLVQGESGAAPDISILMPDGRIPWSGHAARHSVPHVYELIKQHRTTIVFVNTRAIGERIFQDLWALNEENLPIALHHGSLAVEQRRKVEQAIASGKLRAIVATASLDLGLDWGDVDLVIQMGAPKGAARLLQRIGRANHTLEAASRAILVPGNRFEYLETMAACDAVAAGELDNDSFKTGSLDVLAQHLMGLGCGDGFDADATYEEVRRAAPYAALSRKDYEDALGFVETGGYALRAYDRFKRLRHDRDGRYRAAHPRLVTQYRLNAGTIVEAATLNVRLGNFRNLGKVEEWFADQLSPGDTFLFAGQVLELVAVRDTDVIVRAAKAKEPKVPSFQGGRMPLSTHLAQRVRSYLATPAQWPRFPADVQEWLGLQQRFSVLPDPQGLLVETFPRNDRHHLVAYCFEGRNAHQSLGLLITRRMEHMGLHPMGFVANDYVVSVWGMEPITNIEDLFAPDILEEEFQHWMAESSILRKAFRDCAIISGMVERQLPGQKKTGRQMLASTDLIYDVLRKYEPDHVLLRASWADARSKITDLARLEDFLIRIKGRITHKALSQVSPLAVPVMLELGKERVAGSADDALMQEAESMLAGIGA